MLSNTSKTSIVTLVNREIDQLGSATKLANKINVAVATITNNLLKPDNWNNISESMWVKIGKAVGFTFEKNSWNVVDTTNSRLMNSVLKLSQSESMFIAISEKAGSGKTAGILKYKASDTTKSVFTLQCEEWTKKQFLLNLTQNLGLTPKITDSMTTLGNNIILALKERASVGKPILILDEADKLRPAALRFLIHFYNQLEDECGLVICGTENLEKEIKRGVQKAAKGYDEIDSRLGRNFVHLQGITREDVSNICIANGLTNDGTIEKVWREAEPKDKLIGARYISMVQDLRRLKRIIQRERQFSSLN